AAAAVGGGGDRAGGVRVQLVPRADPPRPAAAAVQPDLSTRPGALPGRGAGTAAGRSVAGDRAARRLGPPHTPLAVDDARCRGCRGAGALARDPAGVPLPAIFHLP